MAFVPDVPSTTKPKKDKGFGFYTADQSSAIKKKKAKIYGEPPKSAQPDFPPEPFEVSWPNSKPTLITPLTIQEWASMSPKQQWDVKVCLRGPDHGNEWLKYYTTAIIRHKCSDVMRVGGMVNPYVPAIIMQGPGYPQVGNGPWEFNSYHFMGHVAEACKILNIPIVRIPQVTWISAFAQGVEEFQCNKFLRHGILTYYKHSEKSKPKVYNSLMIYLNNKLGEEEF